MITTKFFEKRAYLNENVYLSTLHCGKKIRDVRIIRRTLRGPGFLLVSNYKCLVFQIEIFKK